MYGKGIEAGLFYAISYGDIAQIARALTSASINIDAQDSHKNTALHLAVINQNLHVVKILIAFGANPNIENKSYFTPIHLANVCGNQDMLDIFYAKENKKCVNIGKTAQESFFNAVSSQHIKQVISMLIRYTNVIDINQRDQSGNTALHLAVLNKDLCIIKILMTFNANPDIKNTAGLTSKCLVDFYEEQDKLDILYIIQSQKFSGIAAQDLLAYAALSQQINLMTETVVESKTIDLNKRNEYGYTVLHLAALRKSLCIVKTLIQFGANPDIQDNNGNTALHLALMSNNQNMVETLIELHAKKNISNNKGNLPIHEAAKIRFSIIIRRFLGEDTVNTQNNNGSTPLHLAVQYENADAVTALVNYKHTKSNIGDKNGNTALTYVSKIKNLQIEALFSGINVYQHITSNAQVPKFVAGSDQNCISPTLKRKSISESDETPYVSNLKFLENTCTKNLNRLHESRSFTFTPPQSSSIKRKKLSDISNITLPQPLSSRYSARSTPESGSSGSSASRCSSRSTPESGSSGSSASRCSSRSTPGSLSRSSASRCSSINTSGIGTLWESRSESSASWYSARSTPGSCLSGSSASRYSSINISGIGPLWESRSGSSASWYSARSTPESSSSGPSVSRCSSINTPGIDTLWESRSESSSSWCSCADTLGIISPEPSTSKHEIPVDILDADSRGSSASKSMIERYKGLHISSFAELSTSSKTLVIGTLDKNQFEHINMSDSPEPSTSKHEIPVDILDAGLPELHSLSLIVENLDNISGVNLPGSSFAALSIASSNKKIRLRSQNHAGK